MYLDDEEFNDEYTLHDDVENDDGDGEAYIENGSGTEKNVDNELSSDTCSDNWSIYGMPAIRFTFAKCLKKHL